MGDGYGHYHSGGQGHGGGTMLEEVEYRTEVTAGTRVREGGQGYPPNPAHPQDGQW